MKLRILTFNWHESYIHLLAKTGHHFDVVELWKGGRFGWISEFRPLPSNCRLLSEEEAKTKLENGGYDRIIAHNVRDLAAVREWPIPKILVFHNKLSTEMALGGGEVDREAYLDNVRRLFDSTRDLTLVFISRGKMEDWGLKGEIIPPGIDLAEYGGWRGETQKVLRVGNFLVERDVMLGYTLQERLLGGIPSTVLGLNPGISHAVVPHNWEELKEFMASHRVYLNTTMHPFEDGYNLSMLEAMATGMPVVSAGNPSSPLVDGINGYVSSDEGCLREGVEELLRNRSLARSMGRKARETVRDLFPIERFVQEWRRVLGDSPSVVGTGDAAEDDEGLLPAKLRVLMSYTSNPQTTAAYLEKALRKRHDVITYGPKIGDDVLRAWNLEKIRPRVKDHDIPYFTADLRVLLDQLSPGWEPDLFLWVESGIEYPLAGIEDLPCPSACYLIDSHLHLERHIEIARAFDHVFIAQKEYLQRFRDAGIESLSWLPLACDPEIHGKREVDKLHDIGFVGSLNNHRRTVMLNRLARSFDLHYERCFLEEMAEVYSRSRIVFNVSVKNDLNMRVFEALCSGSLLLTDEAAGSGLTDLFQDGRHLVIYHNDDELLELAAHYIENHQERERIAAAGREEVLRKHTYDRRVEQMIETLKPRLNDKRRGDDGKIWDTHPEALVLQPYCVGKGIDVGSGFRKTHPDAIGIDIIPKGQTGEHGCMQGMRSVADITASGDDLHMFGDGELDYVVNRHNLEHYVDVVKTLQEWKRVLKVGGTLGMVLPDESKINTIALDPTHKHCFTPESIVRLLELIGGFVIERVETVVENWSFLVIARRVAEESDEMDRMSSNNVVGAYEKRCSTPENGTNDYFRQERRDVEVLVPDGARRILDVGCGEGILGRRLLEKGATEVIGVEVSPEVCRRAERNLTRVICGDIEEVALPFEEGYFDCLILADILEHLKDPGSTLKKLAGYLSPDGAVVASIPNVRYYAVVDMLVEGRWRYEDSGILDRTHLRFFTRKEAEVLFAEAGLEITGITANVDPAYESLNDPLAGEISFGRVSLRGMSPEELRDLFVFQYLMRAQKAGCEYQRLAGTVRSAVEAEKPDEARRVLEEYLDHHPADTNARFSHAEVCAKLGMTDRAVESLDRILLFEPHRTDARELREKILGGGR